jgi:hypothetical protein
MLAATASMYNCTGGNNGDLPTDLSLSDIDEVTSALLTNDAWMLLDTIGGEDKFGKNCAELKSLLIDLELLRDNRAQA